MIIERERAISSYSPSIANYFQSLLLIFLLQQHYLIITYDEGSKKLKQAKMIAKIGEIMLQYPNFLNDVIEYL